MYAKYSITGLRCEKCVHSVSTTLPTHLPHISNLVVSHNDGALSFESASLVSLDTLNSALKSINPRFEASQYSYLKTLMARYKTYIPLLGMLVGVVFIAGAYSFVHGVSLSTFFMGYMGAFFLIFGSLKLYNLKGFVDSFSKYDLITPYIRTYGYAYPFIEIVLGGLYLFGFGHSALLNYACIALSTLTTIGVMRMLMQGKRVSCACLGSFVSIPISEITIVENIVMVGMALALLSGFHR